MNHSPIPKLLLVVAQSGRMLAQMAVNAGFQVVVIDCFVDCDTRRLAIAAAKVASLQLVDIQQIAVEMIGKYGLSHVIYGSGFEGYTDSLQWLERHCVVLANSVNVFRRFQDKRAFFLQLSKLAINFPQTLFTPPDGGDWLLKPMRGEGGSEIIRYQINSYVDTDRYYWQRYLAGECYSVLFVAVPGKIKVLGFNRQWVASVDEESFLFAGIANHAPLDMPNQQVVSDWLAELVKVYPLQGLGSLDFIIHDGRCYLLEINARIPASAQLYGNKIFNVHLQACCGVLADELQPVQPAVYSIVYAPDSLYIPSGINWPKWVVDQPESGAFVGKGQPICSIIAHGKTPQQAEKCLQYRRKIVENILNTGRY